MKLTPFITGLFFLGIFLFSFNSCEIINPDEEIPSFIQIDTVLLSSISSITGSEKHRITDVWVSVGDNFLGAFPLPATIPVLEADSQFVIVDAGIIEDGRSELREIYPFYSRYGAKHFLLPGEITTIVPDVEYLSTDFIEVMLLEGFDSGSGTFFGEDLDGNSATTLAVTTSAGDVLEGTGAGVIELSSSNDQIIVGSNAPYFNVGSSTKKMFMELTYKSDSPIQVGVIGFSSSFEVLNNNFFLGLSARENWTKVYINLYSPVNSMRQSFGLTNFQIALKVDKASTDAQSFTYFENIKVIREK